MSAARGIRPPHVHDPAGALPASRAAARAAAGTAPLTATFCHARTTARPKDNPRFAPAQVAPCPPSIPGQLRSP